MRLGKRLPDILIGILIVVLAVGLGSLLLTQRNRAAAPAVVVPPAAIPAAPGNDTPVAVKPVTTPNQPAVTSPPVRHEVPVVTPSAAQPGVTAPVTAQVPDAQTPATQAPAAQTPDTQAPDGNAPVTSTPAPDTTATPPRTTAPAPNVPVTTPTLTPPSGPAVDTSQPPVVTTPAAPTDTTKPVASPAQPTPAPVQAAHPVATSANRIPLRRDYRVSLGIFDDTQEALSRTAAVRALGYQVYPIKVGERYVVQVGPFASAADAQQAQQDIARGYAGAVVLAPRGVKPPTQDATSQPRTSQAPTATEPVKRAPVPAVEPVAPATNTTALNWQTPGAPAAGSQDDTAPAQAAAQPQTATQRPAPSGPVYLQVGAFDRQESAQKLVAQVQGLGYDATVQAPEGKRVTVLIGPFRGGALLRTETRLDANGINHFRVR